MKRIRDRVAGLDVHRDTVVACCRVVDPDGEVEVTKQSFATTRKGLGELAVFLSDAAVTTVAMEATGVYWRSPYYALEGMFDELWLCNAQHVKNVPGRKSDLSDAEWLADVAAHGMVRPSFVPPPEIRELRELTRYRKTQVDAVQERSSAWRRCSKTPASSSPRSPPRCGACPRARSSRRSSQGPVILSFSPRWPRAGCEERSTDSRRPCRVTSAPITPSSAARSSTTSTSSTIRSPR